MILGMKNYFFCVYNFWKWVIKEFLHQNCMERASSLALTSLLAIVPMVVVMLTILHLVPAFYTVEGKIQSFIFNNFVPSTGNIVGKYISQITMTRVGLPILALVFLFIISVLMIRSIEAALNDIWNISYRRSAISAFMLYWGCLTLGPIILGLGLLISSYILSLNIVVSSSFELSHKILLITPFLFNLFSFTFIYKVIPHAKIKLHHALTGALFTSIVFEIAKKTFALYVLNVPTYELVYGVLAVIPLFILWVFLSWIIFLLGAIVVNGLYLSQARRGIYKSNYFELAIKIISLLVKSRKDTQLCTIKYLMEKERHVSVESFKIVLNRLCELHLVFGTFNNEYILNFDPDKTTIRELYNLLEFHWPLYAMDSQFTVLNNLNNKLSCYMDISMNNFISNKDN